MESRLIRRLWFTIISVLRMNRFIHILNILLVVASCSRDVPVEVPESGLISFRATVETKGVEVTQENLDHFYATALVARVPQPGEDEDINPVIDTFFENVEFSKAGDCYYSETPYYRPAKRPMTFFLYYPSQQELGVNFNWNFRLDWSEGAELPTIEWEEGEGVVLKDFSPKIKISEQVDLLYGFANMPDEEHWTSNEGDIEAVFIHTLAQIEILAKSDNPNYQFKVAGVKIGNVTSKGDMMSAATDHWILAEDIGEFSETYVENPVTLSNVDCSVMSPEGGNAFLLPQELPENAYVAVYIRAYDVNNETWYPSETEYSWVSKNINGKWTASEKYIYKLDFSDWSPSQVTE